jgi:pimeloyl-ACP methyl ester carboxylesterase
LSQVSVPTLVLHARKDGAVPFQCGREFATGIPGARFVDLDSANHILLANEPAFEQFVREVRRFVADPTSLRL